MATTKTHIGPVGKARGAAASHIVLVVLAGAGLAACAMPQSRFSRSALSGSVAPQQAFALPPPGGPAVVDVIERRYSNAIQQDIVLSSAATVPGENLLRVQVFGPVGVEGGATALVDRRPLEAETAREMRQMVSGVAMRRSPLYTQNSYGPFGYAVGTRGGDLCLYSWQRIAAPVNGSPFTRRGAIQVRLRICQTGADEKALLSVMYGYTINAAFANAAWSPWGSAPEIDPRLGAKGQPIYPAGSTGLENVAAPVEAAPAPRARRAAPRAAEPVAPAAPPPSAPPPGAPVVPPPSVEAVLPAPAVPPPDE